MNYYSVKSVGEISESEIDFDFYKEIFPEQNMGDNDCESPECILSEQSNDSHAIQIDRLINHLQNLKKKGSNYVALYYHEDHIGYEIEGLKVYVSTPEEIKVYEEMEELKRQRGKEINDAYLALQELKKKPLK